MKHTDSGEITKYCEYQHADARLSNFDARDNTKSNGRN